MLNSQELKNQVDDILTLAMALHDAAECGDSVFTTLHDGSKVTLHPHDADIPVNACHRDPLRKRLAQGLFLLEAIRAAT